MKKFLLFIVLILVALLLIFNWNQLKGLWDSGQPQKAVNCTVDKIKEQANKS